MHPVEQRLKEARGGHTRRPVVGLHDVPARRLPRGGELLEDEAGQGGTSSVSTFTRSPGCVIDPDCVIG